MIIEYLSIYFIFIIIVAVLSGLIILRLKHISLRIVIPVIAAIILLPALVVYIYSTYFITIPEVVVPDLTGKPLETAFSDLRILKLKSRHTGKVFDMNYPEGQVVSQRPEPGRRVKIGRTVFLITSSGRRRVLVPNLLGRPAVQAEAVLAAKGLRLGEVSDDYVPELDAGIILTQAPLPGEEIDVSSYVSITVSSSIEPEVVEETIVVEEVEVQPQASSSPEAAPKEEKKEEGGWWPWW